MCCSGSRFARRLTSTQNLASNSESGTVCSSPRLTWCTFAAMSSASVRGESTPASASRAVAKAISSSSRLTVLSRSPAVLSRSPADQGSLGPQGSLAALSRSLPGGFLLLSLLRQLRFQVRRRQRVDHRVQVALDHLVQVVSLVADPMIGDPVLREVVGADPLGPVDGANLGLALGGRLRVRLGLGRRQQPCAQHAQRLLLVLQLALLVLAGDHDPGR